MNRLVHGEASLAEALRELEQAWERSGEGWRDQARLGYRRDHLDPLIQAVEEARRGLAECAQILDRLSRECR